MPELRRILRFGEFEFTQQTLELRHKGVKVPLKGQPLRLLVLLLDRAGEVVTRDQMRALLWPEDTFVDFEHSLNTAIKKLRRALGDSASAPRFVETVARQGYRLVAPVEVIEPSAEKRPAASLGPAPAKRSHRWRLALPIVGLVAVLALIIYAERHRAVQTDSSGLALLVSGHGDIQYPAISPDGTMLAYSRIEGAIAHIELRRLAGGTTLAVSSGTARDAEPAFSPDSERIAFTRYPPDAAAPQIWISPALGGEAKLVLRGARNPAWSPNGERLAFILPRPGLGEALATATADGADVRIALESNATYPFLRFPSWSADGRSIAVERSIGSVSGEIWLVPWQGGAATGLDPPAPGIYMRHPVFTADGKGLLYSSNRAGATNLWYYSLQDGNATAITRGPGPEGWPSVSRSGRIVFMTAESRDTLYVRRLDTGARTKILEHSPYLWAPAVSPDGRKIVFSQAEYDGSWRIWVVRVAGGKPWALTVGREPQIYGRFSRNGKWITYFTWAAGADRIWRIPSRGGSAVPLTPAGEDASFGDLSPDSRELAFTRTESQSAYICIRPVAGGAERRLTSSPSTLARWSPDGRWIAFTPDRSFEAGIYIIRPDGSGAKRLTATGSWPVWVGDGKRIAFRTLGADGNQQLRIVRVSDSQVTPLNGIQFSGDNYPVDFSPDGKLLAYTNGATFSSEIWLLNQRP
ncbi:MAG: winged helix-turn-helix domain-containing protein [Terriglobia bacterium]